MVVKGAGWWRWTYRTSSRPCSGKGGSCKRATVTMRCLRGFCKSGRKKNPCQLLSSVLTSTHTHTRLCHGRDSSRKGGGGVSRNAHCGSSKTYATCLQRIRIHQRPFISRTRTPQTGEAAGGGTPTAGAWPRGEGGHTQFLWPSNSAAAWSSTCCRASSLDTPLAKVEASAWTWVRGPGQRSCSFARRRGSRAYHLFLLEPGLFAPAGRTSRKKKLVKLCFQVGRSGGQLSTESTE